MTFNYDNIYNIDCLKGIGQLVLENKRFKLIIIDPPANGLLKDGWDNQWKDVDDYINWLMNVIIYSEQLLTENGSLYMYQWIGSKNPIMMPKLLIEINDRTNLNFKNIIT